jgi:hypothetical protein
VSPVRVANTGGLIGISGGMIVSRASTCFFQQKPSAFQEKLSFSGNNGNDKVYCSIREGTASVWHCYSFHNVNIGINGVQT